MMWGDERPTNLDEQSNGIAETTRYANVGFYLGIVGAMAYPAFLWFDTNRVRQLNLSPTTNWTPSSKTITF